MVSEWRKIYKFSLRYLTHPFRPRSHTFFFFKWRSTLKFYNNLRWDNSNNIRATNHSQVESRIYKLSSHYPTRSFCFHNCAFLFSEGRSMLEFYNNFQVKRSSSSYVLIGSANGLSPKPISWKIFFFFLRQRISNVRWIRAYESFTTRLFSSLICS